MTLYVLEEYFFNKKPKFSVYRTQENAQAKADRSTAPIYYLTEFNNGDHLNEYIEKQKDKRANIIGV